MRSLTRSEMVLLGLCVFLVLFVVHLVAYRDYQTEMDKATQVLEDLRRRGGNPVPAKGEPASQGDAHVWEERMQWLDKRLPKMTSRDQAQAALLEELQTSAKALALDIDGQSFVKPASTPHYQEVAVKMNLDGPERKVFQWVAGLQSPEKFQAIKFLRLRPDGRRRQPEGDCEVIVARWFKP